MKAIEFIKRVFQEFSEIEGAFRFGINVFGDEGGRKRGTIHIIIDREIHLMEANGEELRTVYSRSVDDPESLTDKVNKEIKEFVETHIQWLQDELEESQTTLGAVTSKREFDLFKYEFYQEIHPFIEKKLQLLYNFVEPKDQSEQEQIEKKRAFTFARQK